MQKERRERETEQLVKRRRYLRNQWRKASKEEKEGLKPLWEEVKQNLASLRRADRIRKRRRWKEQFLQKFLQGCEIAARGQEKREAGDYQTGAWRSHQGAVQYPLGSPGYVPRPAPPAFLFSAPLSKLSELADMVRRARAASAPGPNRIPYKMCKYCPGVPGDLWNLMSGLEEPSYPVSVAKSCHSFHPERAELQYQQHGTFSSNTIADPTKSSSSPWNFSTSQPALDS